VRFFGYETIRLRLTAKIVLYLWETFVLTGCGSRNFKRVKCNGCPSKGDPEGGTTTVHGATFHQNAKLCRKNFRVNFIEMKMDFTMVPHIQSVVNGMWSTMEPILPKAPPAKKSSRKTSEPRKGIQSAFFGYKTILLRHIGVIVLYLWENIILTGCGYSNPKRVKSYGCPCQSDPKGRTSTVQGAILLQNAKTVPYEFLSKLYGNKYIFYHSAPTIHLW